MDKKLLEILVCPQCKGSLEYDQKSSELICQADHLAFAIRDDIPVMLVDDARQIPAE
ncbi:MAG: Trm112 family protein [Magnetococcales bacterium]|nr:Trm112 family protein [Magnetococcales bacterium]